MKRSTLIVIVCFALLAGLVLVVSDRPAKRGSRSLDLTDLDASKVTAISISGPEEKKVELKKDGETWVLSDQHLADPTMIDRALEALVELKTSDLVSTSKERRQKYGVDEEKGTEVVLEVSDGQPVHLVLGKSEKGGSYVRPADQDAVFKLQKSIVYRFPVDAKRWLKLKLVDFSPEELKGVEIAPSGASAFTIVPAGEKTWALKDPSILPEGFRFDGKAAYSLAQAAVNVRASELIDQPPEGEETGLGETEDRITIRADSGGVTLHLGGKTEKNMVWARIDGRKPFFKIPEYQADKLKKKLEDLRNLRVMEFDPEKLSSLRITAGKESIHLLRKDGGDWSIDTETGKPPEGFDFDPGRVGFFLDSLKELKASRMLEEAGDDRTGLKRPGIRIELEAPEGPPALLLIGRKIKGEKPEQYYARGNADDALYALSGFEKNRLGRGWELFKKLPPPSGGGMGNIDPETLAKLPPEIRRQLLQQMQQQQMQRRIQGK